MAEYGFNPQQYQVDSNPMAGFDSTGGFNLGEPVASPNNVLQPFDLSGYGAMKKPMMAGPTDWTSMESIWGNPKTGAGGWGMPAIQTFSGLANAWLGMQQYGLAKDQLKEGKRQFEMNYGAAKNTTNAAMSSLQSGRVGSSTPGTYASEADHMAKYGVK